MATIITVIALENRIDVVGLDPETGLEVEGYSGAVLPGDRRDFHIDASVDLRIREVAKADDPGLPRYPVKGAALSELNAVQVDDVPAEGARPFTFMQERKTWVYIDNGEPLTATEIGAAVSAGQISTATS